MDHGYLRAFGPDVIWRMLATRPEVVAELAGCIMRRAQGDAVRPLRVAVTGITASGKSTLATELVTAIERIGRPCIRIAVDGFHNPRAIRYRLGRDSAEGYYRDAYNYEQLVSGVLIPLGPSGDRRYVDRAFDVRSDIVVQAAPKVAPVNCIAILDASFLLRPEIRDHFDYRVFVQTSFEEAQARGVDRDCNELGGAAEAERLYRDRYHAAQRIYLAEAKPLAYADALFINDDVATPTLFVRTTDSIDGVLA